MCGIAGLLNVSGTLTAQRIGSIAADMADALVHRGPNDFGVWVDPSGYCALSNRRLSIIDTSPAGHQPMLSPDGKAGITFNGEIYNFKQLKSVLEGQGSVFRTQTDTEVLLEAVRRYGDDVYGLVDGMYAFAFFDGDTRQLLLARDPFGEKPLYYTEWSGCFAFASELQAFARLPGFDATIDDDAIGEYLTLQYVHAPRTIYRRVSKLQPGHRLIVRSGGQTALSRHFAFNPGGGRPQRSLDELAEELQAILIESVRRRLISDVPLGALLSGGVDSSLVVALLSRLVETPIRTFTLGFAGSADSETVFARQVAGHLKTRHREKEVTAEVLKLAPIIGSALDEPNADSSCLPTYFLSEFARSEVTVALSGDGGDELFGGYERYLSTAARHPASREKDAGASADYFSTGLLIFGEADATSLLGELSPATRGLLDAFRRRIDDPAQPLVAAMRGLDTMSYLPGAVLAKVDRMSMRHSLEVRSPLLSRDVARFAEKLNPADCISDGQGKLVLKRLAARFLPMPWLTRRKTGFGLPLGEWDSPELRQLAQELLLDTGSRIQSWIERPRLRRFLARQEFPGTRSMAQIWSLLILETWLRSHFARLQDATSLRIAFLTPEFVTELVGEGGLSTYVARTTRVLRNMGHRPEVFTTSDQDSGPIDFDGVPVHRVAIPGVPARSWRGRLRRFSLWRETASNLRSASALARALARREREISFDAVQCSDYGMTGLFVKKRDSRPLLVRCSWARDLFTAVDGTRRTLDNWLLAVLERMSVRRADLAYAPSRFLADYMRREHGLAMEVIRPPFALECRPASYTPASVPLRYLIHFGLLGPRKGTDVVAEALPIAWREEPDLAMVWAGREHSCAVEQYRARWGDRGGQVTWLGPIPKPVLYAVLKRAIAAVLPSRCDNLPNTVIESLLLGVPVIGSLGASIDELVKPGVDGELVPIGDPGALARAMVSAWRREREGTSLRASAALVFPEMEPVTAVSHLIREAGIRPSTRPPDARVPARTGDGEPAARLVEIPVLRELVPNATRSSQGFNLQPNGSSALSVACVNASPDTIVVFGDVGLPTVYGGPTWLTCEVPSSLYARPARWDVYLINHAGESARLPFTVEAQDA